MFIYTSDRFKWDAKRLTLFLSVDFFGIHSSYVQQSRREKRDNNGWRIHAESRNAPSTCQAGAVGALSLSPIEYVLSSEQRSLATPSNTHSYNNRYSDAMHRRPGSHASPVRTRSIPRAGVLQVSRRSGSRQLVYTRTPNAGTTRRNA
jgi:hypothetical protein